MKYRIGEGGAVKRLAALSFVLLMSLPGTVQADIYKCVDASGNMAFTDTGFCPPGFTLYDSEIASKRSPLPEQVQRLHTEQMLAQHLQWQKAELEQKNARLQKRQADQQVYVARERQENVARGVEADALRRQRSLFPR